MLFVICCCYVIWGVCGIYVLLNIVNKDLDGCYENGWMGFIEGKNWILWLFDLIGIKMSFLWLFVLMEKLFIKI